MPSVDRRRGGSCRGRRIVLGALTVTVAASSIAVSAASASPGPVRPVLGSGAAPAAVASPALVRPLGGSGRTGYAINQPACATPATPGGIRCFAMRRVEVPAGTRGAYEFIRPDRRVAGPAGGYTPADLATFYGFNPRLPRSGQTIAIVDWYLDAHVLADLDAFDRHYGFATETARSFRVVNQRGRPSPLPRADSSTSVETALDVESARAVCRTCRILLIEADGPTEGALAAAQNTAARLGATEISDSYGEPEHRVKPAIANAYNQPGVVITVATGDNGWYGWAFANHPRTRSQNAASFPSTSPTVVAVSGTTIGTDSAGHRVELVWNGNGRQDANYRQLNGAAGGGCSHFFTAAPFQSRYPGYAAAHCGGKRLAADVSAIADPATGFDVYDSFGQRGWLTIGGTSLASPVTAAMFALAGGAGAAAYPAASLYVNAAVHKPSLHDIVADARFPSFAAGNGFCGGTAAPACGNALYRRTNGRTHNPNSLGFGLVDCSFPRSTSHANASSTSTECNVARGFDGPTGLGAPNSPRLYTSTSPTLALGGPRVPRVGASGRYSVRAHEPVPNTRVREYEWLWGDGTHTITRAATARHTYHRAGRFGLVVLALDSRAQISFKRAVVTVGR